MIEKKVCWWFRQKHEVGDFGLLQSTSNIETVSGECDILLSQSCYIDVSTDEGKKQSRQLQDRLHTRWAEIFKEFYTKPEFTNLHKKELIKVINKHINTKEDGRLKNFKIMCIEKRETIEGQIKSGIRTYAYTETNRKVWMPVPERVANIMQKQEATTKTGTKQTLEIKQEKVNKENQWD